jgi:protein tyrosine/serine phosphatase
MNPDFHPALFHCAAGKDRTGVLSALLLNVLGVARESIGEDYAMTAQALPQVLERLTGIEPYRASLKGAVAADHEARAETIVDFLEALDQQHGGAEAWLRAHGLAGQELDAFRGAMLA